MHLLTRLGYRGAQLGDSVECRVPGSARCRIPRPGAVPCLVEVLQLLVGEFADGHAYVDRLAAVSVLKRHDDLRARCTKRLLDEKASLY